MGRSSRSEGELRKLAASYLGRNLGGFYLLSEVNDNILPECVLPECVDTFFPSDGRPFCNPINEGLATSLAIVHVAYLLSLGYNVGTFLH